MEMNIKSGITWDKHSYFKDGEEAFLISGEFHYFRVPKEDWKRRLQLFLDAGGNCVATYIPWVLHEPEEGNFCFDDKPQRDLTEFLTLCRDMGLFVIGRPGPYQYSEMVYAGLPEWLCRDYPEILAKRVDGTIIRDDTVSYIHPVFLEKVRTWYHEVCQKLRPFMADNGGPIAFVQIDNELTGFHEWRGTWDYNEVSMGFGQEDGRFARWLAKKYEVPEKMNEAYQTSFKSFGEAEPFKKAQPETTEDRRRMKDYQEFYFGTVAEYGTILVSWLREEGIHGGIIHNSGNPSMNSNYLELVKALGKDFVLGGDHYYTLGPGWAQNNPTPQYGIKVFCSNEMFRLMGFPPTILELPGGSACDWPPVLPEDLMCCYMTNLAFGMKGFNYYIYTGCEGNPGGLSFKSSYDFGAPVAGNGEIRPHYYVLKDFHTFLHENEWLARADLDADFTIGLDWDYLRSQYYGREPKDFGNYEAWEFIRKGLIPAALYGMRTPDFTDLRNPELKNKTDRPLAVASSACMAREIQENLVAFVENGGSLILFAQIPYLDADYQPCTILQDYLGTTEIGKFKAYQTECDVEGQVSRNLPFFYAVSRSEEAVPFARETIQNLETGWSLKKTCGGQIVWLGHYWEYGYREQSRILETVLQKAGVGEKKIQCSNPNMWCVTRSNGTRRMAFCINLFSSPLEGNVQIYGKDMGNIRLNAMEVHTIPVE